jgi:hypothetical protein
MIKKLVCGFAIAAMAVVCAATGYNVTFYDPVVVNGTTLKPGDYRLEIKENMAIIKQGKVMAQAPVKIENSDKKFSTNTVRLSGTRIEEIHLGGTRTRVVFESKGTATD